MKQPNDSEKPNPLDLFPLWKRVPEDLRDNMQIGLLLDDSARMQLAVLTKRMKKYGATYKQWYALSQIGRKDGMTQTEFCKLMEVTKGAGTTLIDRLIKGDWAERRQGAQDRRHQYIFLTEKGKDLVEYEIDFLAETYVEVFASLTKQQKDVLTSLLSNISKNWSNILERES